MGVQRAYRHVLFERMRMAMLGLDSLCSQCRSPLTGMTQSTHDWDMLNACGAAAQCCLFSATLLSPNTCFFDCHVCMVLTFTPPSTSSPPTFLNPCSCQVCGVFSRQPMFTPCGHMGCLDCIAASRTACPLPSCRVPYKMQAVDDPERTKVNKAPQWEVRAGWCGHVLEGG